MMIVRILFFSLSPGADRTATPVLIPNVFPMTDDSDEDGGGGGGGRGNSSTMLPASCYASIRNELVYDFMVEVG
jgi:hypothetical protein